MIHKLGAVSAYLGCLMPFFVEPWQHPVETLRPQDQAWLLAEAGFALRALGRPREAVYAGIPIAPSHGLDGKSFTSVMTGVLRLMKKAGRA